MKKHSYSSCIRTQFCSAPTKFPKCNFPVERMPLSTRLRVFGEPVIFYEAPWSDTAGDAGRPVRIGCEVSCRAEFDTTMRKVHFALGTGHSKCGQRPRSVGRECSKCGDSRPRLSAAPRAAGPMTQSIPASPTKKCFI